MTEHETAIQKALAAERDAIAAEFSRRLTRDLDSGVASLDAVAVLNFKNFYTQLAGFHSWLLTRRIDASLLVLGSVKTQKGGN